MLFLIQILQLVNSLVLVRGGAYMEQWYYGNDASCSEGSKYQIEGKATDVCVDRDDGTSYLLSDCSDGTVTFYDYDAYGCTGAVDVKVVITDGCSSVNANDHRRYHCPTSESPWADQQYDLTLNLNYEEGDNLCSESVMSYVIRYSDVCHSSSYPPKSWKYSCDATSDTGTEFSFTGTDCETLSDTLTGPLQTACAEFDFQDDDGFWHGNVGNSIFSCEITGTTKPSETSGSGDDDDLSDSAVAGIVCAAAVITIACAAFAAYWFGLCMCCNKGKDKTLSINLLGSGQQA